MRYFFYKEGISPGLGARLLPIELIEDLFAACGSKNGPADVSYRLRPHLILVDINKEVRFYQNLVVQAVYTVIGVVVADEIANAVDHGLFVVKPLQQFAGYGRALDFLVIPPCRYHTFPGWAGCLYHG